MATDRYGVDDGWWAADGRWHDADPDTLALLRERFEESASVPAAPMWFIRTGEAHPLQDRCDVELDGGDRIDGVAELPDDLPPGVHRLLPHDGGPPTRLVAAPQRLGTWPARPRWGVAVQAYAALSERSRWIGDLRDLVAVGRWVGSHGGTVLGSSPLCEPLPTTPRQPSPYSPSSRSHLDPLVVPFDEDELGQLPGRQRPDGRVIDRDAAWAESLEAFRHRWDELGDADRNERVDEVRRTAGLAGLDRATWHAMFDALVAEHGSGWPAWPEEHRHPATRAVRDWAVEHASEVAFWAWVDEQAEEAFTRAHAELRAAGVALMGDLPVGVGADGFEAWYDQDVMAKGWRVGAPPDPLGPHGQDWGLPPLDPVLLRAEAYEPWLVTLRANLGRYDGLRIDHVMGLFRLFWIPPGGDASHGTYVRSRPGEMLELLVAIAAANGAFVVGEDLGTVEAGVRETLRDRGIAGTKVAWFEDEPAEDWSAQTLGTLTTHDLPTTTGALRGTDPSSDEGMVRRMLAFAGRQVGDSEGSVAQVEVDQVDVDQVDVDSVLVAAHQRLARAGSAIVLAALEDVVGSPDRVNLPGTVDEYPNWRVPLPVQADRLDGCPSATRIAAAMDREEPPRRP